MVASAYNSSSRYILVKNYFFRHICNWHVHKNIYTLSIYLYFQCSVRLLTTDYTLHCFHSLRNTDQWLYCIWTGLWIYFVTRVKKTFTDCFSIIPVTFAGITSCFAGISKITAFLLGGFEIIDVFTNLSILLLEDSTESLCFSTADPTMACKVPLLL